MDAAGSGAQPASTSATAAAAVSVLSIGNRALARSLSWLPLSDMYSSQLVCHDMRRAAHAALAEERPELGVLDFRFTEELANVEVGWRYELPGNFGVAALPPDTGTTFEGCTDLRCVITAERHGIVRAIVTTVVKPESRWAALLNPFSTSITMYTVDDEEEAIPVEMEVLQCEKDAEGKRSYTVAGEVVLDEEREWHAVWLSPDLMAMYESYMSQPARDGVLHMDGIVHSALVASLNSKIDALAAAEPADYLPNSNNIIRALVHPSLYCFVIGESEFTPSEQLPELRSPDAVMATRLALQYRMWGRLPRRSKYQWLPSIFDISERGRCSIATYINNLDRSTYGGLYTDLERLFEVMLPRLEAVVGYAHGLCSIIEGSFSYSDLHYGRRRRWRPANLRGRELQVITTIVDYEVKTGQAHAGEWKTQGMVHEPIIATGVYILKRDNMKGGKLAFKRPISSPEGGYLRQEIGTERPPAFETFYQCFVAAHVPVGSLETPEGRMIVFPSSHISRLGSLVAEGGSGKYRVVMFSLIDVKTYIPSTREVPAQQSTMSLEKAKENQLALAQKQPGLSGHLLELNYI